MWLAAGGACAALDVVAVGGILNVEAILVFGGDEFPEDALCDVVGAYGHCSVGLAVHVVERSFDGFEGVDACFDACFFFAAFGGIGCFGDVPPRAAVAGAAFPNDYADAVVARQVPRIRRGGGVVVVVHVGRGEAHGGAVLGDVVFHGLRSRFDVVRRALAAAGVLHVVSGDGVFDVVASVVLGRDELPEHGGVGIVGHALGIAVYVGHIHRAVLIARDEVVLVG